MKILPIIQRLVEIAWYVKYVIFFLALQEVVKFLHLAWLLFHHIKLFG